MIALVKWSKGVVAKLTLALFLQWLPTQHAVEKSPGAEKLVLPWERECSQGGMGNADFFP